MNEEKIFSQEWLGRTLTIKTGRLALQANAAVTVQYGDTVVLATVVQSKEERDADFFPLMVDFEERLYAAGIIKGSRWIKREGRPSDESVLTGRMIDRSIRPLFDESSRKDVQVILTILSVDKENDHDIVSLIAASAALSISGVKWAGPLSGVRVGRINNELVFNPTYQQRLESDLDLIVAGTKDKTVMIEAGANEIAENDMFNAIMAGQEALVEPIKLIEEMKKALGDKVIIEKLKIKTEAEKTALEEKSKILDLAESWLKDNAKKFVFDKTYYTKGERKMAVSALKEALEIYLAEKNIDASTRKEAINKKVEAVVEEEVTNGILERKQRVDGRKLDELRTITADVNMLPRNHGAGLFSRGETQVLSIVTLGAPGLKQMLEGIEGQSEKRYMHHYNFPPYSVGEARPARSAGRREIGHGALAEKAIYPLLPDEAEFPYTIRVVSETLGSNGSSSMASTCGSSLALMDAGVPLKKAVAGIAMGLASNEDMSKYEVLTDLQDLEDGKGGMDFKIAGTADGITAIQLDTKTLGLTREIIKQTLDQGKKARLEILEVMNKAIPTARPELSAYAPRILTLKINPEKIGAVIGTGGKVINKIIAATECSIDITDDGTVLICGVDAAKCEQAAKWVNDLTREVEAGEKFLGKVVRMLDFGAFVEILPGKDGLVHVSEMAPYRVGRPQDLLAIGDEVNVFVKEIDDQGRVNLSMKGLPENAAFWKDEKGKAQDNGFAPRNNQNSNRPTNGGGFRR